MNFRDMSTEKRVNIICMAWEARKQKELAEQRERQQKFAGSGQAGSEGATTTQTASVSAQDILKFG
jgi:hypothetical protein